MELEAERAQVCRYARRMGTDGLVVGTSGNISTRVGDRIAITPSGVDYAALTAESITVLGPDGAVLDGALAPSSEVPMHLAAYRQMPDVRAVVHTHSAYATAVSTVVDVLPSIHYLVAVFGGPVRVAPYATYGTPELADSMVEALRGRHGCLLANHGTVTTGTTLAVAYDRARQLEWLCQVWLAARSAGTPALLPPTEIERVADKLRNYGQT